jgi:quercetin dioxygenase-like cupin family protein
MDIIAATQHDILARQDYELCREVGIKAVREAARWPVIDRGGVLDLEGVRHLARLGQEAGLTIIWDLMHYGYPDDLDPFSDEFIERFAAYARAVAGVVHEETQGATYYTPINEISYLAWSGAEIGYMAPFEQDRGPDYKRILVKASIAAIDEIREVDPGARIVNADPLVRVHPPEWRPDLQAEADFFNAQVVHETFDLLSGRREPELGGSREYLGILGLNYYSCNQWTIATPDTPQRFVTVEDPNWVPLSDLLFELHERYGGPLLIAETGGTGEGRPGWINYMASEARKAIKRGVDLQGICLYPLITSPDWEDPTAFFDGGLFDVIPQPDGSLKRVLSAVTALSLREAQAALDPENLPTCSIEPAPKPRPEPELMVARPAENATFKMDNFSYQTLISGEGMLVEIYGLRPGDTVPAHRHQTTEHVLTVICGEVEICVGRRSTKLQQGETILVPAGLDHTIYNCGVERLVVQQVSSPKPWDARFVGPYPSGIQQSPGPHAHNFPE